MLKILAFINGWRNSTVRGGDYHVLNVLKKWNKENKISLVIPKVGYESTKKISTDWDSIYLSSNQTEEVEYVPAFVRAYLFRTIKSLFAEKKDHDLIIASSHLLYDVIPALYACIMSRSKLVVYVFHIFRTFRKYHQGIWNFISLISEKMSLFLCKKADLIFVSNEEIKQELVRRGFKSERVFVSGNGVDHALIDSTEASVDKFDACFCGSIDRRKGIYDLLYVWEQVLDSLPASRLVIIGQGPEYGRLLRIIKEKGLERNIFLTGYLPEEQKISAMKSSKLFIFPSYEEGWGIAIAEAMACGLVVVCYDLDAYNVFGNRIVRIEIANKEAMGKAVRDFVNDKIKLEAVALRAKEGAKDFSWDNIAAGELKEIINN